MVVRNLANYSQIPPAIPRRIEDGRLRAYDHLIVWLRDSCGRSLRAEELLRGWIQNRREYVADLRARRRQS